MLLYGPSRNVRLMHALALPWLPAGEQFPFFEGLVTPSHAFVSRLCRTLWCMSYQVRVLLALAALQLPTGTARHPPVVSPFAFWLLCTVKRCGSRFHRLLMYMSYSSCSRCLQSPSGVCAVVLALVVSASLSFTRCCAPGCFLSGPC